MISNIEEDIAKMYISKDPNIDIKTTALINTELPFRNLEHDIPNLFNRQEIIYTKTTKSSREEIVLELKFISKTESKKSYIYSCFENKSFDSFISIGMGTSKRITNSNGVQKLERISYYEYPDTDIRIPQYISFGGNTPSADNTLTETNNPGGSFVLSKGITKYVTLRIEQAYVYPRLKKSNKPYIYHGSFISKHPSFKMINEKINPPQFLTIDIDFSLNKVKCVIDSKKSFLQINVILLIHFLSHYDFDKIRTIITRGFNTHIVNKIDILLLSSISILENYNNQIESYINSIVDESYSKKKDQFDSVTSYFTNLLKNFLPHITTGSMDKAMYLLSIFRQFIVAMFQPEVYPDKDNLATRRISTAADIFENLIKTSIDTAFLQAKDKYKEIKSDSKQNIGSLVGQIKILPQTTALFNNVFNMQDTKNSDVIRIATKANWYEPIMVSNIVVRGSSIELTKSLAARNLHESTIGILDIYDTPDHGSNAGLIKRLAIGARITHHVIDRRRQIFEEIKSFIDNYIKSNNASDPINGVMLSIIEETSEFYITSILENKIEDFIQKLKKMKRENAFVCNDIGIEAVPIHEKDEIKLIYVPTNKYFQIRINVGNKRAIQPMFVVTNGELEIDKIDVNSIKSLSFTDFIIKYPNAIEFLDVGQCLYSRICNSVKEFRGYNQDYQKRIEYVRLPNYLCFSQLSSCMNDIGRMAGVRGTFGNAQQKHIITGPPDNVLNKNDACTYQAYPQQKSCVTNLPKEISGISRNGLGHHILIGFFSLNKNIEDGVIVNKKSVESGMLAVITLNTIKTDVLDTQINNNNPTQDAANNNYSKIGPSGLPAVGTVLVKDDALYRRLKPKYKETDDNTRMFDQSEPYVLNFPSVVERTRKQGTDIIKIDILMSAYRRLCIGDKLAKNVQKVTISDIVDYHKLPYTEFGERPDLIFNSTSIISRKTFPMYIDAMLTNVFGYVPYNDNGDAEYINYPAYTEMTIENIIDFISAKIRKVYPSISDKELHDIVYCKKTLYNPYTHKPMQLISENKTTKAFIAPILFSRLSQMSADKLSARNRGRLDKYGQPPSGKKKGGGIKIGEMEVDVFLTHAAVSTIAELISDPDERYLPANTCSNCGIFATYEDGVEIKRWKCLQCENMGLSPEIISSRMTYATKIFITLLNMRGISLIVKTNNNNQQKYLSV